jgi:hypothetical protein
LEDPDHSLGNLAMGFDIELDKLVHEEENAVSVVIRRFRDEEGIGGFPIVIEMIKMSVALAERPSPFALGPPSTLIGR